MSFSFEPLRDRQEWEQFSLKHGANALFQTWEWGETLEASGGDIRRFGIWNNKTLIGVFLVAKIQARRGAFLHVRHGPIFSDYSSEIWNEFTAFMKSYAKKERVLFYRISPLIGEDYEIELRNRGYVPAAIHAMDAELCWVLPLEKSPEHLMSDMRKTTRYEIRRAEKMGIEVSSSRELKDLHYFMDLYNETSKRQGFVQHKGIEEEFEIFAKNDKALLYYAIFEQNVIAAAIILFVGNQAIYHHGASQSHSPPGSYSIQWHAIQEAKKRGMKEYNFWGIAPDESPNHPWKGITLFKKGFGGGERKYLHAQDYPVSPLYLLPKAIETFRRMRKGY